MLLLSARSGALAQRIGPRPSSRRPMRHAGIASGINNAVARIANLLAVALLPLSAGITGHGFHDSATMTDGFHTAMLACAGVAAAGGALA